MEKILRTTLYRNEAYSRINDSIVKSLCLVANDDDGVGHELKWRRSLQGHRSKALYYSHDSTKVGTAAARRQTPTIAGAGQPTQRHVVCLSRIEIHRRDCDV